MGNNHIRLELENVDFRGHSVDHFLINQLFLVSNHLTLVGCDNCTISIYNLLSIEALNLTESNVVFSEPDYTRNN